MSTDKVLLAGSASDELTHAVAQLLNAQVGCMAVERFPDGETTVCMDETVRARDVFIIQATSPPVNENVMILLGIIDACRRASAGRITAIIPYFGYARADKRGGRNEPIMARLVADLLETAGVDHVLLIDPHTFQMEGFFHAAIDSLTAVPLLCETMCKVLPGDLVVVSPDAGRVKMASEYGRLLKRPVAVLHKHRSSGTETEVTHLVGDVQGHPCLLIDDMISTGGTLEASMRALLKHGAAPKMFVAATHGLFLGKAAERLAADYVARVFITDTVQQTHALPPTTQIVSVAPLIANAIQQVLARGRLS